MMKKVRGGMKRQEIVRAEKEGKEVEKKGRREFG